MSDAAALRRARPGDAPALAELHIACWREAYGELVPPRVRDAWSVADRREAWERILVEGSPTWVAEGPGGELVGFASAGPARDDDAAPGAAELYALYVRAARWGSGVGGALHDRALEAAAGRPAIVWTFEDNARARRFYERHGWRLDGGRKVDEWDMVEIRYGRDRL
jgi:GNAT superfamily N-acetyltransferase